MSAASVKLRPNKTAATRSVGLETLTSWRLRFDANKCVAAIAVVKGRNEANSRSRRLRRMSSGSAALRNRVMLLCAIHTPPMNAKLTK
jgi:hypothetical protein